MSNSHNFCHPVYNPTQSAQINAVAFQNDAPVGEYVQAYHELPKIRL